MYKKYLSLLIICLFYGQALWSVMAYPYPVEIDLPDGSKLEIQRHGDEFFNYTTDSKGFIIAQKKDGFYYYADYDTEGKLRTGNNRVGTPVATRSAQVPDINFSRAARTRSNRLQEGRHLTRANARQAVEGRLKTLVLLVAFEDQGFVSPTANDDFHRLKNELGYSDNGATGSVRDYYLDNSNGVFDPEFVVMGPYTLDKPMSYYGGNNASGNDSNPRRMVIEAAWQAYNEGLDFSQFDADKDGYVDIIYVYYAGYNEAEGGPAASIWPHAWSVATMDSTMLDGVRLGYYACSSELKGSKGNNMTAIGTSCHEYAHTLGLMDMYDTDGIESGGRAGGLGYLSLMSAGNYNNDSRTPPYLNAEERYMLGWMTPVPITEGGNYSLASIDQDQAYIMHTSNPNEYFLLENRQPNKWDAYLQGQGMLIYHVDKSNNNVLGKTAQERWYDNSINVYPAHQCMDLEEACGSESRGDAYAFFPGSSDRYTEFSLQSTPAAYAWSGLPLGMELYDIKLEGDEISFRVEMETGVFFGGQVYNRQGQAVSGAILHLKKVDDTAVGIGTGLRSAMHTSEEYYTCISNIEGRFIFDDKLTQGKYELLCQSEAYMSHSQILDLQPGSNSLNITLMTEEEQLIEGSLSWCQNFSFGGSIGNEGERFMAGARWTAEDLYQYTGKYIGKMTFYIAGGNPTVLVKIFSDDRPIYTKSIAAAQLTSNGFFSLDLLADSLLIKPEKDLILAYEVSRYDEKAYPAGICAGSRVEGKGNLISLDGGNSWTTLYQEAAIEGNWLIAFDVYRHADHIEMESFDLEPSELTMKTGESRHLLAQIKPVDASNGKISWSSSDSAVVYVDQQGKITALHAGSSVITATTDLGRRSANCQVQVVSTIASSLDVLVGQHVFYMNWDPGPADSWKLCWKDSKDSVYQDTTLVQSDFLLGELRPKSFTDVRLQAFSAQELIDEHTLSIITANVKSEYMALPAQASYKSGDKFLLDVLNLPQDATVLVWKLDDVAITSPLLELSSGIYELKVEVQTREGKEIIRRQIKVE